MNTKGLNLFIVDDNKLVVATLKQYLIDRFGLSLNISSFYSGESCLEKIDKNTDLVILDYTLPGINGLETLKLIKEINPKTEVIMLSGNENMAVAIQTFRAGATDYVIKGVKSEKKIIKLVNHILKAPIRLLVKEFGISLYMAIFLSTFVTMGIIVFVVLNFMSQ